MKIKVDTTVDLPKLDELLDSIERHTEKRMSACPCNPMRRCEMCLAGDDALDRMVQFREANK